MLQDPVSQVALSIGFLFDAFVRQSAGCTADELLMRPSEIRGGYFVGCSSHSGGGVRVVVLTMAEHYGGRAVRTSPTLELAQDCVQQCATKVG